MRIWNWNILNELFQPFELRRYSWFLVIQAGQVYSLKTTFKVHQHGYIASSPNLHIPSCYCFHIFFYWVSSEVPADERWRRKDKPHTMSAFFGTFKHRQEQKSVWNLKEGCAVEVGWWGAVGSRAVWSRQGQTVARHPEELPLCPCTATGCNLLLRDKTKLTRPFSGDLTASLGQQHAPAPTGSTSEQLRFTK